MKVACDKCLKVDDADKKRDWLIYRAYPSGKAYLNYGLDAIWKKKLKNLRYDIVEKAVDRLAEYEDSNLTPAEVVELAQAKADGRLIVLPCKVGDKVRATVLRPYNGHTNTIFGEVIEIQPVIRVRYNQCRHIDFIAPDFGKTVFLTREEAEAALAKEGKR